MIRGYGTAVTGQRGSPVARENTLLAGVEAKDWTDWHTGSRVPWNVMTFPPLSLNLPNPSTAFDQVEIPIGSMVSAYSRSETENPANDREGSLYIASVYQICDHT